MNPAYQKTSKPEKNKTEEAALVLAPQPLSIGREPDQVLEEATKAATALKRVIDAKPKRVTFNGETYLENEDWLTVARFYGVTSRIRETRPVKIDRGLSMDGEELPPIMGYEAIAEAFLVQTGAVISTAESMCLKDEPNWSKKPLFQLRSMAQTRASSRVLRQVFGWVVVLAGYKATPAEEMGAGMGQEPDLPEGNCYECGMEIYSKSEIKDTKQNFGKTLCRVCRKHASPLAGREAQANAVETTHDFTGQAQRTIAVNQHKAQARREAEKKQTVNGYGD